MQPVANVQIAPMASPAHAPAAAPWAGAHWVETTEREPTLLAELGIPLRCFHGDRGYFLACFLPERGWYWATGAIEVRPERWAVPVPRTGRKSLAF